MDIVERITHPFEDLPWNREVHLWKPVRLPFGSSKVGKKGASECSVVQDPFTD